MIFVSNRPGGCGGGDIYATRFHHRHGWQPPENLGCTINSAAEEAGPARVRHELYFSSTGMGDSDIYVSPAFGPWIGPPCRSSAATTWRSCSTLTALAAPDSSTAGRRLGGTGGHAGYSR